MTQSESTNFIWSSKCHLAFCQFRISVASILNGVGGLLTKDWSGLSMELQKALVWTADILDKIVK